MFESFFTKIKADPIWYLSDEFNAIKQELFVNPDHDSEEIKNKRRQFISKIGDLLEDDNVSLSQEGPNFDEEREVIDTIVIHHTGDSTAAAANPISYLNALHLLRLYVPEFRNEKREYYGQALWSNHFWKNRLVFFGYHYLIWPDGRYEQLLKDEYIGWHCGNWQYNKKSIAICFLADLENSEPSAHAMVSAKKLISKYNPTQVLGHGEIKESTSCPGNKFLVENGWKNKLLN